MIDGFCVKGVNPGFNPTRQAKLSSVKLKLSNID